MSKILIAEDDKDLSEVLQYCLTSRGYSVKATYDGQETLDYLRTCKFDLLILDWMLPRIDGLHVLEHFREDGGKTPILMLTAKSSIEDKEAGLDAGADDYLTKPFHTKELIARVRSLLRRPPTYSGSVLECGDIVLDPASCTVNRGEKQISLRPMVYQLLEFFMRHPQQVFSPDALLERVWKDDSVASPDTVRAHIKLLRKAIDEAGKPSAIQTNRGQGYMLKIPR